MAYRRSSYVRSCGELTQAYATIFALLCISISDFGSNATFLTARVNVKVHSLTIKQLSASSRMRFAGRRGQLYIGPWSGYLRLYQRRGLCHVGKVTSSQIDNLEAMPSWLT